MTIPSSGGGGGQRPDAYIYICVECPLREDPVEAIFGVSYGPGTMKFVISDPKKPTPGYLSGGLE